jgi:hypothetical protein
MAEPDSFRKLGGFVDELESINGSGEISKTLYLAKHPKQKKGKALPETPQANQRVEPAGV